MTEKLELLTFDLLIDQIRAKRGAARAADVLAGWDKLLEVVTELIGSSEGSDTELFGGRTWTLVRVRIAGYQGISEREPLVMVLNPMPGVTVIHGPNGSGKSSVADAIETGLQGWVRPPSLMGSGGKAPLWERVHCGRDAEQATVELTLAWRDERLHLRCSLAKDGATREHVATRIVDGTSRVVDLDRTDWRSAIIGHRPVFAYAALERRVQRASDLQAFLEDLLAFGSSFDALKQVVDDRSAEAKNASSAWAAALKAAQAQVRQLDATTRRDDRPALDDLVWPTVEADPDQWLADSGLAESGAAVPEVTATHGERLRRAADAAVAALDGLEGAETSLHARLADPLRQLHDQVSALDAPGNVCPVCDAVSSAWPQSLGANVQDLTSLKSVQDALAPALRGLRGAADQEFGQVRAVLLPGDMAPPPDSPLLKGVQVAGAYLAALETDGIKASPQVRSALRGLAEWLLSSECEQLVREAAEQSSHHLQWRRARRAAVDHFVDTWRRVRTTAMHASVWESATRRITDLQTALRGDRATVLSRLTDEKVQQLLADVGIRLHGVKVQGTKAVLEIADADGKALTLAMLSAGQRNALLLAPLLAVTSGGPFGFLVLDDPVHAFDQVRVDRLASVIHELAQDRRVIVLTHDERLKEHLAARGPHCDTMAINRDAASGKVSVDVQQAPWQVMLDDARGVLQVVGRQPDGVTVSPTDLVRGLCRQAVDTALRQFVLRVAVREQRDPAVELEQLDDASTTKDRLRQAKGFYAESSSAHAAVANAEARVLPCLPSWNRAAHGNPPESPATRDDIRAAEDAAAVLADSA